ncbi:hypothetical protein HCH_02176 [Hahella chejuensis KCTC 2396]|uniref:Uncharacterized protein n=1 Tax=Hahella chejuensis (strain KCTC 2396) TaxID=349521 RepID=Q2SK20_HAHCH|nr:hypothetical protein HCH_02176 [Hahella chejuensis KCTC 2396]
MMAFMSIRRLGCHEEQLLFGVRADMFSPLRSGPIG